MKLLALTLAAAATYGTWRLALSDSPVAVPVAIFTLFTYWLTYEVFKTDRA